MGSEVYNLKTLDIENTVVRQSKPGLLNNQSTNLAFSQPDLLGDYIFSGLTGIYTGERNNETEYLIQGSLTDNYLYGIAIGRFIKNSKIIELYKLNSLGELEGCVVEGLGKGDFIRNEKDLNTSFFEISEVTLITKNEQNLTQITLLNAYTSTNFESESVDYLCTIKKIKKTRAQFEYVKNKKDESYLYYNSEKLSWGVSGLNFTGPISTPTGIYTFPEDDVLTVKFQDPATSSSPIITVVKSEAFTVVENNKSEITDIPLPAIPYPHQSLKVYIRKNKGDLTKAVEGSNGDYVVNYTQNPDYLYPFPPQRERQVGFIKLLDTLNDKQDTVTTNFNSFLSVQKSVQGSVKDLKVPITNIIPDSEIVSVGSTDLSKNYNYLINYGGGLVTFVRHKYNENLVGAITYPKKLYWDGVSVIRGIGENDLIGSNKKDENKDLVINPICGLSGITGIVYFEDTISNNLVYGDDYLVEYNSGSIKINEPLETDECILISYYCEGEDEERENLLKKDTYRTSKFPVLVNSVTISVKYVDYLGNKVDKILEEGIDFDFYYLTGLIKLLGTFDESALERFEINYTPLAQINCILQPDQDDSQSYKITIIDDALKTIDTFNLIFEVKNPTISTAVEDPFKRDDDKTKVSYTNSVIQNSLLRMGLVGRDGFGFGGLSNKDMIDIGATGLVLEGMGKSLGISDEYFYQLGVTGVIDMFGGTGDFNTIGYTYNDTTKRFQLDGSVNNVRPDLNDVVVATYSYTAETIPYAPLEAIFPNFEEGLTEFKVEGFDRTDILREGMIIRVDNFDPPQNFYFKIKNVAYDGNNTIVGIYGSIPVDIRMPSFRLFDGLLNFITLPSGTVIKNTAAIGSSTLVFKGSLLELKELIKKDKLLMINSSEIYHIQSSEILNESLNVTIFPSLQSYIYGEATVSEYIIYEEDSEIILTSMPISEEVREPVFTVIYEKPTYLDGSCTIVIDDEKIIIRESIDGVTKEYLYYFNNYKTSYQLYEAITNTVSKFYEDDPISYPHKYYPFKVTGKEYFYLNRNQ